MSALPGWLMRRPARLRLAALLLAAGVVALVQALAPQALATLEAVAGDLSWRGSVIERAERRVVVVDIDESSLDAHGAWPWPRDTLARLSRTLDEAGVAVQAIDIVLDAARPGDDTLRQVWADTPVVLGQIFALDPDSRPRVGHVVGPLAATGALACPPFAPHSTGYIANAASVLPPQAVAGHLTPWVPADGVVRELPGLVCHEGRAYPSLALVALWRAAVSDAAVAAGTVPDWRWQPGEGVLDPAYWLLSDSLPGIRVPVDAQGRLRVPFRVARASLTSVSAAKVLAGRAPPAVLDGALVLLGATAFGIGDITATPLTPVASGVEVHAQLMAGLLDNRIPYTPRHAAVGQWLGVAALALLLWGVAVRRGGAPARRLPLAGLVASVGCVLAAHGALQQADQWWPWAVPALYALLASAALATAEHALARAERRRLSAHLGAYLPAPVAQRLMASEPSGQLQVQRRPVSVMLADIRNFSAFAQYRPPEETAALLHAFYCVAVDVVEQQGGIVEQIAGDAVLAVWNAYADCPDHPARALQASRALLRDTRALFERRADPALGHRVQPLALGIGLETGLAVVGSFGPARRRAHAALGEPVSVASRLQQMTQDLSMPLLIGPEMARQLPPQCTESLGEFLLEGLQQPYTLYGAVDTDEILPPADLWTGVPLSGPEDADDNPWQSPAVGSGAPQRHGLAAWGQGLLARSLRHARPIRPV